MNKAATALSGRVLNQHNAWAVVRKRARNAEAGNEYAMYSLGYLYRWGQGVALDYGHAREWYQKAAEKGKRKGHELLGLPVREGPGRHQGLRQSARVVPKGPPKRETPLPTGCSRAQSPCRSIVRCIGLDSDRILQLFIGESILAKQVDVLP